MTPTNTSSKALLAMFIFQGTLSRLVLRTVRVLFALAGVAVATDAV